MKVLKDKKVVITGASGGIGRSLAQAFAREGALPILTGRNKDKLLQTAESVPANGGIYALDVTSSDHVHEVFDEIRNQHGQIDILVNNAGYGRFLTVDTMDEAIFMEMMDVNYMGTVRCTKAVLPDMLERGSGHIVNLASAAGKIGVPKSAGYAATKHAVVGFSHSLRYDLMNRGIGVSLINPGPVNTPFFDIADPEGTYLQNVKRWMLEPEQVANAAVKAVRHNKAEINLPSWSNVGLKLMALFPSVMDPFVYRLMNRK